MSARGTLWTSVVVGVLAVVIAGCATAQKYTMGTGDPVADRQRLMKNNGANWAEVQNKAKAGNIEGIVVNAEAMALHAQRITSLFPEGSRTEKSKAKPEIWQKWAEFEAAAKNYETRATQLAELSRAKNADAVQATVKEFGRQACGTCHSPFRVPPPQR